METATAILSELTTHMKYARYLPAENRRETWTELVSRNMEMHIEQYPNLTDDIREAYQMVMDKKVLPSMRSMQFGGKPIHISPNRIYNCAYCPVDDPLVFSEAMFLLLGGTGVGYSVQKHHIRKLPSIRKPNPNTSRRFLIGDNIEGWADAVKVLLKSYLNGGGPTIRFDFSAIREKGAILKTSGGKAPGPRPLMVCLAKIEGLLSDKKDGEKLSPLECHDIMCHIADAVLAGGIRRAAMISLFSADDDEMLTSKTGSWWELNPQRGRANNSVVLLRHRITKDVFNNIWERVKMSGSGEPGFYLTNDKDWGTNPCCEIALRPYQFCNLTEINASNVESQEDLNARAKAAAFIGTLQAGYTDFHYLRPIWKETTEKDALIGVSMTGIASGAVLKLDPTEAAEVVKAENARVANIISIKSAARTTCVKPAGTTSLTLGTSSGIHAWHAPHYIRRIRVNKNESVYEYLEKYHADMIEDAVMEGPDVAVISVPQKAPEGSIYRTEGALDLLNRVKFITDNWVKPGHGEGQNSHNVSATISIKDGEWDEVREWMWNNRESYNGLSVLPHSDANYVQMPFEDCTEEVYEHMMATLTEVDTRFIIEDEDNTDLSGEVACGGGACEIVFAYATEEDSEVTQAS